MREKLIKILRVPIFPHELADPTEVVADYLLDNDVVPVVRCKDCKHWWKENEMCNHPQCCDGAYVVVEAPKDHYCGYGERKTDG